MIDKPKLRIAIVISHPIQHFCPQYVSFAQNENIELKVFFASTLGFKKYVDVNFGKEISWGNLHLDKFNHHFLNGDQLIQADKNLDAPSLEKELNNFRPDLIFTYGYFQKLQRRAKNWAIKNKVKIAYISDSELRHKRNPAKEFFKAFFLKQYFTGINYFLTMGNANEAFYQKYQVPPAKFLRMHYPIDVELYRESYLNKQSLRNITRERFGIKEKEITLCVVGKLVEWKNQDHIIDAMEMLESEGIYLKLFMLGSGEMKDAWESKAKKLKGSQVFFSGFVNIEELPSYYAASDIYVHPASLEPHSVAISEAIMMGCPVVLSDRCGSYGEEDDVQVGKNGFVFEFGNIKDMSDRIKSLATNEVIRREFAQYSNKIANQFQTLSHHTIINNLLQEVAKNRSY